MLWSLNLIFANQLFCYNKGDMKFEPKEFEPKWQEKWAADKIYEADESSEKPPAFVADMFPYPSGSSMHVGHPRGYVATDVYARYKRMNGFNVLHPMGWDAFGLPAEETAIENKEYPTVTVERNIAKFKSQLISLGIGYDWSREINTTDPQYYKHTQRIFLEFFKLGLALNNTVPVNWCPELGTVLANEDIVNGKSERGGYPVYQMPMRQWVLAITKYADRLIDDLELLPQWPEKVKNAQRNWIGRSEGHEFEFVTSAGLNVPVYTTKIETLPGATFLVLAPDIELVQKLLAYASNSKAVEDYIEQSKQKTELDRQVVTEKTGVVIEGVTATNPATGQQIPIVVADYVLSSYGTGAIMAVPHLDERDKEMAAVLSLPVVEFAPLEIPAGVKLVGATAQKRFKIRDWVFSRQRFWGEPFPIVWVKGKDDYDKIAQGPAKDWLPAEPVTYYEEDVQYFAVPVLPQFLTAMQLPKVDSYEPTGNIEGPLAGIDSWVNAQINPTTGEVKNVDVAGPEDVDWIPVKRETNTMPQWAGSSWYWLRYMDPHNAAEPFSKASAKYWGPVNVYSGADHAVAHLIYGRFWHKVMQDAGMVDFPEPFERLEFLGYILASDGTKISKRKGNSRSPEEIVAQAGADAFRLYEMFIGPFEKPAPWNDNDLLGARRFLERVWRFAEKVNTDKASATDPAALTAIHKAIQKVSADIETFKFNTAVASLMICLNEMQDRAVTKEDFELFLKLLAPFVPHMTEELWAEWGEAGSVHTSAWPQFNPELIKTETISLPIQVNGKHRADIGVSPDISEAELKELVLADANVQKYLEGQEPKQFIYVPGRIVNVVI
jgi:leucyl-tRNA synthetase